MNWPRDCAAVIPCHNEVCVISDVVRETLRYLPAILVVDDGSTDETAARARAAGAEVLRLESNRGKGAALKTGWQHLRARGFKWALCLDGDGQHAPSDIPAFFQKAPHAQLVVGDRTAGIAHMPWLRRITNCFLSREISRLAGRPIPDSQCGFRLMDLACWEGLAIDATHFEIESDMILRFARAGYAIDFAPIQTIYKTEQSKIHPFRDGWRWIQWWRRMRRSPQIIGPPPAFPPLSLPLPSRPKSWQGR